MLERGPVVARLWHSEQVPLQLDAPDSDLAVALRAALVGASVGLSYFEHVASLDQDQKADGSIVTEVDLAVETEVRSVLATDSFIGEETGSAGRSNRRWILDGIDGTLVFVLGDDRWQSLIALEVDGVVQLGIAIVPSQSGVWFAQRGCGAFRQAFDSAGLVGEATMLRTSGRTELDGFSVGFLPPLHMVPREAFAEFAPLLDRTLARDWSAHAALLVACGELDAAAQVGGKIWDYAPLGLIVEEAKGAFSAIDGSGHPNGIRLSKAYCYESDVSCSQLREARLTQGRFAKADFDEADLRAASCFKADLRHASLRGATLRGASLCQAKLRGSDLTGADLRDADLRLADLREAF